MSIQILGVITKEKVDKVKVNKHLDELSNKLFEKNIEHLIIDDSKNGVGIMIIQNAPNFIRHNDKKKQWEYLERYIPEGKENAITAQTFIIEDGNKKVNILDFINIILKIYKEN